MPLPSSGPLSLNDIQTEFGGTNPISLNEYYAGGGRVPAGATGTFGPVPSSGAISVQNFYGTSAYTPIYVQEVFSTLLYTGNNTNFTYRVNNINLSGKGGMVWIKSRSTFNNHNASDTVRGANQRLNPNRTFGQQSGGTVSEFISSGFRVDADTLGEVNAAGVNYVSWTFREEPKFFDVVTYTGNGTSGRQISHSLGSAPGFIVIKRLNPDNSWIAYHRILGATKYIVLNSADPQSSFVGYWNNTEPTSTVFTLGNSSDVNGSGGTFVAYLFAHNAGGFGPTGTDNIISCGSYTGNGSAVGPTVTLGYEPQWVMIKDADVPGGSGGWQMLDAARGIATPGQDKVLVANSDIVEVDEQAIATTATGFQVETSNDKFNRSGSTFIYIAIRKAA